MGAGGAVYSGGGKTGGAILCWRRQWEKGEEGGNGRGKKREAVFDRSPRQSFPRAILPSPRSNALPSPPPP